MNNMLFIKIIQKASSDPKLSLFLRQKELLDTFLSHHAISQAQYDKSLGDLIVKMGIDESLLKEADRGQ